MITEGDFCIIKCQCAFWNIACCLPLSHQAGWEGIVSAYQELTADSSALCQGCTRDQKEASTSFSWGATMLLINPVGHYEFPVIKANRQKKHKPNSRGGGRTQAQYKPLSWKIGWSIRGHQFILLRLQKSNLMLRELNGFSWSLDYQVTEGTTAWVHLMMEVFGRLWSRWGCRSWCSVPGRQVVSDAFSSNVAGLGRGRNFHTRRTNVL